MWIFLNDAMISVVQPPNQPDMLLVRARVRGDLETLALDTEILEDAGTDYKFRCTIPRATFKVLMDQLIDEVDYPNFKGSIDKDDELRHGWYMSVWAAGMRIQQSLRGRMTV